MSKKNLYYTIAFAILLLLIWAVFFLIKKNKTNNNSVVRAPVVQSEWDLTYGNDNAPLAVFMFSDYNCTFCRRFLSDVFPEVQEKLIDEGVIKFIIKLISFSNSQQLKRAYKTAICLNKHGNFDQLNQLLLMEPTAIYTQEFDNLVEDYIHRNSFFAECMLGGAAEEYLMENKKSFIVNQFKGTPTFVVNNKVYRGYMDYEKFERIIKKQGKYTVKKD